MGFCADFQRRIFEATETAMTRLGEEREQVEQSAFNEYGQKMQEISATLERIGDKSFGLLLVLITLNACTLSWSCTHWVSFW